MQCEERLPSSAVRALILFSVFVVAKTECARIAFPKSLPSTHRSGDSFDLHGTGRDALMKVTVIVVSLSPVTRKCGAVVLGKGTTCTSYALVLGDNEGEVDLVLPIARCTNPEDRDSV